MLPEPRVIPDEVGDERSKCRPDRDAHQDKRAVKNAHCPEHQARVDSTVFLHFKHRTQRTADSDSAHERDEAHDACQQQKINQIEPTGPRVKGKLCFPEPTVAMLVGLQPLMHEGRHHVKRDQGEESI
jgi:hypothetical protein